MADKIPADIKKLSFEEALDQLEAIVDQLERGDVALEESLDIYARGAALKAHCAQKLKSAEERIEKIIVADDGSVSTAPADLRD